MPLLAALAQASRPLSLSELARETRMTTSKAHKYLASFARAGAVEQDRETGLYDLGALSLAMGLSALRRIDVSEIAYASMVALRDRLNQTITLTAWMPPGPTIVRVVESSRPVNITLRIGSVLPLLSSSSGPLFTAYLPPTSTQALIERELAESSATLRQLRIHSRADVDDIIARIRKRQLAHSAGTVLPGVIGLSAPVFDHSGLVATLSIVAVEADIDLSWDSEVAHVLVDHARALSARLGHDDTP